ncbi:hypothetical protein RCO48_31210 [Peribacillus frigoritolerans]|nr:hypothetical protein [Peribacillus frigoritolerans]
MEFTRIPDLELYRTIVENFHDGILAMNQEGKNSIGQSVHA